MGHTQSGLTACGGGHAWDAGNYAWETCRTLTSNAEWKTSHRLLHWRRRGVSWNSPEGIILLGGDDRLEEGQKRTSELIANSEADRAEKFALPYDT